MKARQQRVGQTQFSIRTGVSLVLLSLALVLAGRLAAFAQQEPPAGQTPAPPPVPEATFEDILGNLDGESPTPQLDGELPTEGAPAEQNAEYDEAMTEGKQLFEQKQYDEALEAFERALAAVGGPERVQTAPAELHYYLGRTALELGQPEPGYQYLTNAVQAAETAAEDGNAPKEYYYERGRAASLLAAQDPSFARSAVGDLSKAIRLDQSYADAYHQRGVVQRAIGNLKRAQKDLERAISLDANKKEYRYDLGLLFYLDEEYQKAIASLTDAIRLYEQEPDEGKTEEELEQGYPEPYVARAAAHIRVGKRSADDRAASRDAYQRAAEDSLKAIEMRPEAGEGYFNLGLAYRFLGQLNEAVGAFSDAIVHTAQNSPSFADAYLRRGITWYYLGDYALAETDFNEAIGIDDQSASYHLWLGLAQAQQGRPEDAMQAFDRAIQLRPDYLDAHLNRGLNNLRLGQYEKGIGSFNRYIALRHDDPTGYYLRGVAQGYLGQNRQAANSYSQALRLDPNHEQARYNLGLINGRLGPSGQVQDGGGGLGRLDQARLQSPGGAAGY